MGQRSSVNVSANPSITTWTRLEPLPREGLMQRSLQGQVRDAAWMLARQYMVGEFLGEDGGPPIHATMQVEFRTVTTYRPGVDDSKTVAIDPGLPVEVHVEREAVSMRLRGSVQLGMYFETLARSRQIAEGTISRFRQAFCIASEPPDPTYAPPDAQRFRHLVAGRVTDGEELYGAVPALLNDQTPPPPLLPADITAEVKGLLNDFKKYRQSLFTEPSYDSAWRSSQPNLSYDFALGSPVPNHNLLLRAPEFAGGRLDWYSFSVESGKQNPVSSQNPAKVEPKTFDFLPNHVVFRGMPGPRWWEFEDSVTDFGELDVDHVDLAKLLVMEFALICGPDWFSVPVPVTVGISGDPSEPRGTLSRVTSLVVTDTFGVRTLIRPSEQTKVSSGESPWSMFKLSGKGSRSDFILMAPTLGLVEDADALEDVLFLRDDMAAMAWAVEHHLQGDLDSPVDAHEMYLQRLKANPPLEPPQATPGGPQIYYTMETVPPDYWKPMVSVRTDHGALYLRRGTIEIPDPSSSSGFTDLKARALILEPDHAFFVADHVVLRSGIRVDRYFRRVRSFDGTTFVWLARKSGLGSGPGLSRLRFDIVRDKKPAKT